MTCEHHESLEDLIAMISSSLAARGRAVLPYRNDLERELLREATALAARLLARPTHAFDRPDGFHVTMPGPRT